MANKHKEANRCQSAVTKETKMSKDHIEYIPIHAIGIIENTNKMGYFSLTVVLTPTTAMHRSLHPLATVRHRI
jgi:hypothetical protein